jgi:hypothetical protein
MKLYNIAIAFIMYMIWIYMSIFVITYNIGYGLQDYGGVNIVLLTVAPIWISISTFVFILILYKVFYDKKER